MEYFKGLLQTPRLTTLAIILMILVFIMVIYGVSKNKNVQIEIPDKFIFKVTD